MSTESQASQKRMEKRTESFRPAARKVNSGLGGFHNRRSISEPVGESGVSPGNQAHLKAEYRQLIEQIQVLEEENASLRIRVRILQELCLLD